MGVTTSSSACMLAGWVWLQEAKTDCWRWSSTSLLHGGCDPRTLRRRSDSDLASLFPCISAPLLFHGACTSRDSPVKGSSSPLCSVRTLHNAQLGIEKGL